MKFSRQNRVLITIMGSDALRFSSGLWTCDLKLSAKTSPASTKGYLLNTKGQALAEGVFIVLSEQNIVLSVLDSDKDFIVAEMQKVLVADDVEINVKNLTNYATYICLDCPTKGHDIDVQRPKAAQDHVSKVIVASDYFECIVAYGPKLVKEYWVSPVTSEKEFLSKHDGELVSDEQFNAWRVQNNVALWRQDIEFEKLLLNYPVSKCVSFYKGCYRGQEIIARATHRGNLQVGWGAFSSDSQISLGNIVNEDAKTVGQITTVNSDRALGTIRLKATEEKIFCSNGSELKFLKSFR